MNGDKMKIPEWILPEVWEALTNRERDYLRLIKAAKYTKTEIMRYLYFDSNVTFWRFKGKLQRKISL